MIALITCFVLNRHANLASNEWTLKSLNCIYSEVNMAHVSSGFSRIMVKACCNVSRRFKARGRLFCLAAQGERRDLIGFLEWSPLFGKMEFACETAGSLRFIFLIIIVILFFSVECCLTVMMQHSFSFSFLSFLLKIFFLISVCKLFFEV